MAFVILALLVLLVAAVTYGVFFLIFKLIWVIAGKSRNKWPFCWPEPPRCCCS